MAASALPIPAATMGMRELTLRGVLLGGLITLFFTAANVYLGLKVGITFATSIPAAVISMAILRFVRGSTILENNIVQTIASAAGTLAAIIFVLPGLIMIGWWTGFPYWTTVAVCAIGGTLGVMFSVPLRRALVTGSDLPYPEGVAAAEVLKVGAGSAGGAEENARGLAAIVAGSLVSAGFALLAAMKLVAVDLATAFRVGARRDRGLDQPVDGADRRRPSGRPHRRHRDADRHAALLGRAGAVADRDPGRRPGRRRRPSTTSSATRSASSAPARSASPRSGPCSRSSARSSAASARRWPPRRPAPAGRSSS